MPALESSTVVGVVGAGTMGAGIAQVAAAAGHPVLLFDARPGAVADAADRIAQGLEKRLARGKTTRTTVEALLSRIRPAESLADLACAGLIVEAIAEDLETKRGVFAELERHCGDGAILASNTSSLSITALGAALSRPERLVGMHFFNPAPALKLVEVVSGLATAREVADTVFETAVAWGKQPAHARSTPGFIVNRVARPFYAEALRLLQEGAADAATIDAAMRESGGFAMGPFELMDLIGHDVNLAVTRSVFEAYFNDPRFLPSLLQRELVEAGRLGRKTGRGFYDYAAAERPAPAEAASAPAPNRVTVRGDLGPARSLLPALRDAFRVDEFEDGPGVIESEAFTLALTDGRSATQRAAEDGIANLVVFDLALDYASAARAVVAAADQASDAATAGAAGFFQALGKAVSVIDDVPGLAVMRTVCMLANEAADAVNQGVCSVEGCDTAMRGGVNYPRGPLAWAEQIGLAVVAGVLRHLAAVYGEDRYRLSPLLQRKVWGGSRFY